MYQGFYNLTSGMLTQRRNLDVISNNMVNIQTPGHKRDTMTSTTFQEEVLYRTGTRHKDNPTELGRMSKIRVADETLVNYEQGGFDETGGIFDFALRDNGFFCVQGPEGVSYTRNGAFEVDEEGYLALAKAGRILGADQQPIQITSEDFRVDSNGNITVEVITDAESGETEIQQLGQLKVVDFADYSALQKNEYGTFNTDQQEQQLENGGTILWKSLESSNVNMVDEMTAMMSAQRAVQSAAQVLKMYDQVMGKTSSDIGRI